MYLDSHGSKWLVEFYRLMFISLDGLTAYMLIRWGKSPGLHFLRLTVFQTNFKSIGFRRAFWRISVDVFFSFAYFMVALLVLWNVSAESFHLLDGRARLGMFKQNWYHHAVFYTEMVWLFGNMLSIIIDKKRRALHDFIAGTVVVDSKTISSARLKQYKPFLR